MNKALLVILFSLFILVVSAQEKALSGAPVPGKSESELKVYPNPCKNDQVTLEFSEKQISEVHFINLTGKEVLAETYFFPVQKAIIRVADLPNGIYILRIVTSEQKTVTQKLMVTKN